MIDNTDTDTSSQLLYCAYSGLPLGKQPKYLKSDKGLAASFHSCFSLSAAAIHRVTRNEIAASGGVPAHEARLLLLLARCLQPTTLKPLLKLRAPIALSPKQSLLMFDTISLLCSKLEAMAVTERADFYQNCPKFSSSAWITSSAKQGRSEYLTSLASHATGFIEWLKNEVLPRIAASHIDFTRELHESEIGRLLADSLASSKIGRESDVSEYWPIVINECESTLELGKHWAHEARYQLNKPNSETFMLTWAQYLRGMASLADSTLLVSSTIYTKAASAIYEAALSIKLGSAGSANLDSFANFEVSSVNSGVDFEIVPTAKLPTSELPSTATPTQATQVMQHTQTMQAEAATTEASTPKAAPLAQSHAVARATELAAKLAAAKEKRRADSLAAAKALIAAKLAGKNS